MCPSLETASPDGHTWYFYVRRDTFLGVSDAISCVKENPVDTCQIELYDVSRYFILSLIAETQIGLRTYTMQMRLPV